MDIRVALFDADGVVLKDEGYFSTKLAKEGLIASTEVTGSFFTGVFQQCLVGKADLKEELAHVIGDWGWDGTVDELVDFWFTVGDDVHEGVEAYIDGLKKGGVTCYMTSDQERYRGEFLRSKLGAMFEGYFFSNEVGYKKKDRGFFEHVLRGIKPRVADSSQVLFVDDGEENIANARSLDIEAIHFRTVRDLPNPAH